MRWTRTGNGTLCCMYDLDICRCIEGIVTSVWVASCTVPPSSIFFCLLGQTFRGLRALTFFEPA